MGKSLCEKDLPGHRPVDPGDRAAEAKCDIVLPVDAVVAGEFKAHAANKVVSVDAVGTDEMILDIGPVSVATVAARLAAASTLVWNGPFGAFELAPFDAGTVAVAREAARLTTAGKLLSVAGGWRHGRRAQPRRRGGRLLLRVHGGRGPFSNGSRANRCRGSRFCASGEDVRFSFLKRHRVASSLAVFQNLVFQEHCMTGLAGPSERDSLARIEAELAAMRQETVARLDMIHRRFDAMDESLDRLKGVGRRHSAEVSGLIFMGKAMAGQWSLEIAELDRRLTALESPE